VTRHPVTAGPTRRSARRIIDTYPAPQSDGTIVYQPFPVLAPRPPAPADLICLGVSFGIVGGILLLIGYSMRQ